MAEKKMIICLSCKEFIEIGDANLKDWLEKHIRHSIIVDYDDEWYKKHIGE